MNLLLKYILLLILLIEIAIATAPISILLLGDSLTIGYTDSTHHGKPYHPYAIQLAKNFMNSSVQADIIVNGLSGDRVVDGRFQRRLRESIKKQANKGKKFDWIVILGGTNDCFNGYSADIIFAALRNLYAISNSSGAKVFALTIMDFTNVKFDPARTETNELIRNHTGTKAADGKVILYDLASNLPKDKHEKAAYYQPDGIHLKVPGYDHMGDLIYEALSKN